MKILYAANSFPSSHCLLKDFQKTYVDIYNIKTSGYSSSIKNLNCNFNLDALLNFSNRQATFSPQNDNYKIYERAINKFKPDLIISDLEHYTSYIGLKIGIPVWQVSSLLLYYGIAKLPFNFPFSVSKSEYTSYILEHSKKMILSHLGDFLNIELKPGYQFVRPRYADVSTSSSDGSILDLAAAYYNGCPIKININYNDLQSIFNGKINDHFGLNKPFTIKINQDIKFLSQHLSELI